MNWNQWLIVIPARLESTRLPRKPLQILGNHPLICQVARRLSPLGEQGAKIIVATDSVEVEQACKQDKIEVTLTATDHPSGTDRVFEVASKHTHEYVLNVQGDEPFVNLEDLSRLASVMQDNDSFSIGTLLHENTSHEDWQNPNVVKAVVDDTQSRVLYFSRSPIPYHRHGDFSRFWHHVGVYAFRRQELQRFCGLPPSKLEQCEGLEQLRALENNFVIGFAKAAEKAIGIDTPEDLEAARALFQHSQS